MKDHMGTFVIERKFLLARKPNIFPLLRNGLSGLGSKRMGKETGRKTTVGRPPTKKWCYSAIEHLCKKDGIEPLSPYPLQPKFQKSLSDNCNLKRNNNPRDRCRDRDRSSKGMARECEAIETENDLSLSFPRVQSLAPAFFQFHRRKLLPPQKDSFTKLPDEMILKIFKWLPKSTLGKVSQVCRRFERLSGDETLWRRIDLLNKILNPGHLGIIMSREPVYLRLARATIRDPVEIPIGLQAPQLLYLDLSMSTISPDTLTELFRMCTSLVKLSVEHMVLKKESIEAMQTFATSLDTLNCTMCYEIDALTFSTFLTKCPRLQLLNLGCVNQDWSKDALTEVVSSLPHAVEQLNVSGFRHTMTDTHVSILTSRCPNLIDLDLSDCQEITMMAVESIANLSELQHLALSRCYGIEPASYPLLADMPALRYLELYSLFKESSIKNLTATIVGVDINSFPFSSIARPTVGMRRSSIWLERVRD